MDSLARHARTAVLYVYPEPAAIIPGISKTEVFIIEPAHGNSFSFMFAALFSDLHIVEVNQTQIVFASS